MVRDLRYVVQRVDDAGSVLDSHTFQTQRAVVEAFPAALTASVVREAFRARPRVRLGAGSKHPVYRRFRFSRYSPKISQPIA